VGCQGLFVPGERCGRRERYQQLFCSHPTSSLSSCSAAQFVPARRTPCVLGFWLTAESTLITLSFTHGILSRMQYKSYQLQPLRLLLAERWKNHSGRDIAKPAYAGISLACWCSVLCSCAGSRPAPSRLAFRTG
jgi:hypothetical protein